MMKRSLYAPSHLFAWPATGLHWLCQCLRRLLAPTGSIAGWVTDPSGAGVPGAQVTATALKYRAFGPVVTDHHGAYTVRRLSPGAYKVDVQAPPGFQNPAPAYVQVRLCREATHTHFQLVVLQPGAIAGQVTDRAGAGVQRVQVRVTGTEAHGIPPLVATDANGHYYIPNVLPGLYTVHVQVPGFDVPPPQRVRVQAGQDTADVNFRLTAPHGLMAGRVTDKNGAGVQAARVTATAVRLQVVREATTDSCGYYTILALPAGTYTVQVQAPPGYLPAHNVQTVPGVITQGIKFSLDVVRDVRDRLETVRLGIETPINREEATQAAHLFPVANLVLVGLSRSKFGSAETLDVLGVLNLYYGLQDKSLTTRLPVHDSRALWDSLEHDLKALAIEVEQRQSDIGFLHQEAKRQFNLGPSTSVPGNVRFPALFNRYVGMSTDPLLALDLQKEEAHQFFDRARLVQAYDLLRELKELLLQIVKSLSVYGTIATRRVNEDWADFTARALEVLSLVAQERVTDDLEEQDPWTVLAMLAEKNRETQIAPYVVLGRHGGKLLAYALQIYDAIERQNALENFDRGHLLELFQPKGQGSPIARMRKEATAIKRYPLANWG